MRARARTHTHTHTHHCCCMICLFACLDSFDYTFVERRKCGTNLQRRDKIKSVEQLSRGGSNSTGNLVPWSRRNKSPEKGSNSLGNMFPEKSIITIRTIHNCYKSNKHHFKGLQAGTAETIFIKMNEVFETNYMHVPWTNCFGVRVDNTSVNTRRSYIL